MKRPIAEPGQGAALFGIREASAFLGLTQKALRQKVFKRTVPFRKDGRKIVFIRRELEAHVDDLPGCTPAEARNNLQARTDGA